MKSLSRIVKYALIAALACAPLVASGQQGQQTNNSVAPLSTLPPVFGGVQIISGPGTSSGNPLYVTGGTGGGGGGGGSGTTQLLAGTATIGSIANTAFNISGAIPGGANNIGFVGLQGGLGSSSGNPLYVTGISGGGSGTTQLLAGTANVGFIGLAGGLGSSSGSPLYVTGGSGGGGGPSGPAGTNNATAAYVQGVTGGVAVPVSGTVGIGGTGFGSSSGNPLYVTGISGGSGGTGAPLPTNTTSPTGVAQGIGLEASSGGTMIPLGAVGVALSVHNDGSFASTGGGGGTSTVAFPYAINQGDNQPINQATPTAGNNGNAIGIMGYDSAGNNVDRLQDTAGSLNVNLTNTPTVGIGAGSAAIGTVGFSSGTRGTTSSIPLYTSCVTGCSGSGGGGGSAPSTWTTAINSSSTSAICPNQTTSAQSTCTIVTMTVGCTAASTSSCTGALAQGNIGAIYDSNSTTAPSAASQIYAFSALGGATGFQTVQPWGANGYKVTNGGIFAETAAFCSGCVVYFSGIAT